VYCDDGIITVKSREKASMESELRAIRLVLELFPSKLKKEHVCWFTDNQNVVRIAQCETCNWRP